MKGPAKTGTKQVKGLKRSGKDRYGRESERALRESEAKLDAILRSIPDHISMMDGELNIVWANDRAMAVFGKDIVGRKCYEVYHRRQEPCEPYPCLVLKTFGDGRIHEHDTEVLDRDGRTIRFHCTANVALRDGAGSPATVLEISRDVTSRRRMEEELRMHRDHLGRLVEERTVELRQEVKRRREKEEQYLSLIESVKEWIWQMDANFVHTYLSARIEDVLGYKPEELLGRSPVEIMPPDEVKRVMPLIKRTISRREPFVSFQNVYCHKDGRLVSIEANGRPFFDKKGKLLGYRGSCHDVTEKKKFLEDLGEREQELTAKSLSLEELNAALRVLLKQREEYREELQNKFVLNVRELVLPYIDKAKKYQQDPRLKTYLDVAATNLNEILSPYLSTVKQFKFTPREIEVSSLIKEGKTTREIAQLMGVEKSSIDAHRDNIRKKLGLNKKKANLRTHLLSLK